jgi:uncharacterized protein (DUF362 family)
VFDYWELEGQTSVRKLARREFLKGIVFLGALVVVSYFLPGCLSRNRAPALEEAVMSKVSLVRTSDRADGVRRAIALLDTNPVNGKAVVLKPNFNSADVTPGSTHIDTLRALVQHLKDMGATGITLAERSGPGDSTHTVMEKKGVFQLAEELGFDILDLQAMAAEGWVHFHPENSHWRDGFMFPKIYTEADCIVQTCCLKTHAYGGHFTLSMKNSVGMVPGGNPYMSELHTSPNQRQLIAEINTAYSPDLVVLDGVEAFVDGGPARGTRANANVVLASNDRVAIDAVGVAILRELGTNPEVSRGQVFEQDQIERAAELGLGVASAEQIELVSDDPTGRDYAEKIKGILLA